MKLTAAQVKTLKTIAATGTRERNQTASYVVLHNAKLVQSTGSEFDRTYSLTALGRIRLRSILAAE